MVWTLESGVQINNWNQVLVFTNGYSVVGGRYVKIKYVPNDEVLEF